MFVRSSKFRHVFGSAAKKEHCYEGIRVTKSAHDSNFCAVNRLFLAVVIESAGGGAFLVLQIAKTGRADINSPKVCGHRNPITDIKWNPFDDTVIASSSEDTTVKLWRIPEEGLTENITQWSVELVGHSKKVSYIEWHPSAENILLSAGSDLLCIIWNTSSATQLTVVSVHRDTIYSIFWNHDGSAFATTCKDRVIRVIDPRTGRVIAEGEGHQGTKASKVVFVGKNRLFTTGFSRHSERQYALWNISDLSKPLKMEDIDSSSGLLIPFYDHDTGMVFLGGKGDGNIRYFEIVDTPPYVHFLSQYQSSTPQRGLGIMPKCGVDVKKCEIVRFYKLHAQKDFCEPISMIVPRKSELFQADIYPPTASSQPAMTAEQWMSGVNRDPTLVSLQDGLLAETKSSFATNSNVKLINCSNKMSDSLPITNIIARTQVTKTSIPHDHSTLRTDSSQPRDQESPGSSLDWKLCLSKKVNDCQTTTSLVANSPSVQSVVYSNQRTTNQNTFDCMTSGGNDNTTRHHRLSRNVSDVSDLSTTTPVTPLVMTRSCRLRQRNDNEGDASSSSCSSTEALTQSVDDAWCENPLYGTKQPGRHRHHHASKHRRRAANSRFHTVDTGPLDDLLVQTAAEKDRFVSRSNTELHSSNLTTVTTSSGSAAVATQALRSMRANGFRSEPDVALTALSLFDDDDDTIFESGRGTMIDCISVEAPDDTLVKPSRLRASMNSRQRRRQTASVGSADEISVTSVSSAGGVPVQRSGSLREKPSPNKGTMYDLFGGLSGCDKDSARATPVRETQDVLHRPTDAIAKSAALMSLSSSTTQCCVAVQGSIPLRTSPPGSTNNHFTFVLPADMARRRAAASQVQEVLPSFNRSFGKQTSSISTTHNMYSSSGAVSTSVPYQQLLQDFRILQDKFGHQQDELKKLRDESALKDLKIAQLENQLRLTRRSRDTDSGAKLYHGHNETVIGVKGRVVSAVKGVC